MTASNYVAVYGALIILASLLGGWLPSLVALTHQRMQMMVSAVAGLMLGVAFFNLLPHAAEFLGSFDRALVWTMGGLLTMFLLMRADQFRLLAGMPHRGGLVCPRDEPTRARRQS